MISREKIIEYIEKYISTKHLADIKVRINHNLLSRISVGFGKFATIKIKNTALFREYKLLSKLVHEIDVHIIRHINGKKL